MDRLVGWGVSGIITDRPGARYAPASAGARFSGYSSSGLVGVRRGGHRLQARHHALEPVRQRTQVVTSGMRAGPCGCVSLAVCLTDPVLPVPYALQRLGQLVGAVHQQAPRGEAHLPVLVDPDHVYLVGKRRVTPAAPELFEGHHATHVPDPLHRVAELSLKALLDLVHRPVSLLGSGSTRPGPPGWASPGARHVPGRFRTETAQKDQYS
jgi:hypothetical protein